MPTSTKPRITRRTALLGALTASTALATAPPAGACSPSGHCVTSGPVPSGQQAISKYGACCSIWGGFQEKIKEAGVLYLSPDFEVNGVTFKEVAKLWNGRSKIKVKVANKEPLVTVEWNDAIVGGGWGMAGMTGVMYLGSAFRGVDKVSSIQLLAHEVGHILSLHHSGGNDTLMNTRLTGSKVPTDNDYQALRTAWGDPDGTEDIEDVEYTDEEKSEAEGAVEEHIRVTGMSPIENERHLLGMENYDEMLKIAESLNKEVTINSRDSLSITEDQKLGDLQSYAEDNKRYSSVPGTALSFVGLVGVLYGLLMVGAAVLDSTNKIVRFPLIPLLTFGRYRVNTGDLDSNGKQLKVEGRQSLGFILAVAIAITVIGLTLASGGVQGFYSWWVSLLTGLFG